MMLRNGKHFAMVLCPGRGTACGRHALATTAPVLGVRVAHEVRRHFAATTAMNYPPGADYAGVTLTPPLIADDVAAVAAAAPPLDVYQSMCLTVSVFSAIVTYAIMFDWIYQGHLDLWAGDYGADDDDDDDDDD